MSISPILLILILAAVVVAPIKATNPRKLDQTTTDTAIGGSTDGQQIKCGGCPCNNPCSTTPPPPPPPSPPPPKKPSLTPGLNCPPPPAYIYMNGPPSGNLYPVDPYASSADGRRVWVVPPLLVVIGVMGILSFW